MSSFGYTLLSNEYKNPRTELLIECPNNHIYEASWWSFKQGGRCSFCYGKNIKKDIPFIKEFVKKIGYECLSTEYRNAKSKLKFRCNHGHVFETTWDHIHSGNGCKECKRQKFIGDKNPRWGKFIKEEEKNDFITYRRKVYQETNQNYNKYEQYINPNNLKRGRYEYSLDHIYSVYDGFKNKVDTELISSPVNLRLILSKHNRQKFINSDISLEELLCKHNQFCVGDIIQ